MAAPYSLSNVSVTKGVFRNVESESGAGIVWKRGSSYTMEYYNERYVVEVTYVFGGFVETQSNSDFGLISPLQSSAILTGFLLFTNSFSKNPFQKDSLVSFSQPNFGSPGTFKYSLDPIDNPAALITVDDTADLEASDFFDGVFRVTRIPVLQETVSGFLNGGTGRWWKFTVTIDFDAEKGQGWIQSRNTTINTLAAPAIEGYSAGSSKTMTVFIEDENWEYTPPFPPPRNDPYEPDDFWNPGADPPDWTDDPTDLTTLGGGRYGRQFVAVGHRKLYFGDL